jgi:hypothetical protein
MSFCLVGECENPDVKSDVSVLYLTKSRGKNLKIWIAQKNLNLVFEVKKKKS